MIVGALCQLLRPSARCAPCILEAALWLPNRTAVSLGRGYAALADACAVPSQDATQDATPRLPEKGATPVKPAKVGAKKTFYRRVLPSPPAIAFSSPEGRQLFTEALQQNHMSGFFKLIEQYSTQDEPAFCGLASLAMVLNALSIDPRRTWKGNWRWFHEKLLDCCAPIAQVMQDGIVLRQAARLAQCNGAKVVLRQFGSFGLEEFRQEVTQVCRSGDEHLIVSYTRKAFLQTGGGHFSPIGGFHKERDLVLILDTARFKYPPHWVPVALLYEAMGVVDPATGEPRGYMRISANPRLDSVLFSLDVRTQRWREADTFMRCAAPQLIQVLAGSGALRAEDVVRQLVGSMPLDSLDNFIVLRQTAGTKDACEGEAEHRCIPTAARQQLLDELRGMTLFQVVSSQLSSMGDDAAVPYMAEKATMLLLLLPPSQWRELFSDPAQQQAWEGLMDSSAISIVQVEVDFLREQFRHVEDVLATGSAEPSCTTCAHVLDCHAKGHA